MRRWITIVAVIIPFLTTYSQNLELSVGMAFPETMNFSARYVEDKFVGGLSFGFLPGYDQSLWTFSGDLGFTFGKMAENAESRRAQVRICITYYREETEKKIFKYGIISPRVVRNFFFTNNFGIGLEAGIAFKIAETIVEKAPSSQFLNFDVDGDVAPSLAVRFFYRIY